MCDLDECLETTFIQPLVRYITETSVWFVSLRSPALPIKLSTDEPAYLHYLLKHYVPSRSLRSSDSNLLSVPRIRTCFGSRSFPPLGILPLDIRNSPSICNSPSYHIPLPFSSPPENIFLQMLGHLSPHHTPCASDSAGFSR